ncbi:MULTISPECIES: hypothetical protein [unclassified Clostridium]|jgi:spore coat protein|uniref:hypothetical protein n=1 Tax=unclassified Clostridium TaxID=2614128 RepID=UPI0025C032A1|nr:hypothetical protein [Clostridium sp.]MCI6692908.1 hypothetical protein [Clostridium sp.]MDY2630530.1 hypothetical protein [Clostridium sp.]MDY4253347.1 hypothetical protein [Clostridium sp.]MDY6226201.1 hypothetical protein [Clostridium sp.]
MQKSELSSYLEDRNIYVLNSKISKDKNEDNKNIYKQIENIIFFNNKIGQYKENLFPRIGATIGKEVNMYYSQIILISKYLREIENKDNLNSIDFYLINRGELLIDLGKKSLNHINKNGFKELIKRSMSNYEVCLTRVDEGNLKVEEDGSIKIGTIRYMTYNLKEHDIYSYIKKIKRREVNLDIEDIINYYISITKLGEYSKEYLKALVSYPNEEFRIIEKYILGKLNVEDTELLESLNRARTLDSNSIII